MRNHKTILPEYIVPVLQNIAHNYNLADKAEEQDIQKNGANEMVINISTKSNKRISRN